MTARAVLQAPDPRLRVRPPLLDDIDHDRLEAHFEDLAQTMSVYEGAGIAAPQIGVHLPLALVRQPNREGKIEKGSRVLRMCNLEILEDYGAHIVTEGCLSMLMVQGTRTRPQWLKYRYVSPEGEEVEDEAEDLFAQTLQHEAEHLLGRLWADRFTVEQVLQVR